MTEPDDATALLAARRESQNHFSTKISELARYMGFGLAGAAFALLSSESKFATRLSESAPVLLIICAVTGCLAVLLDYLQMLAGWMTATLAANNDSGGYTKTAGAQTWSSFQSFCFYSKQVVVALGAVILIATIATNVR